MASDDSDSQTSTIHEEYQVRTLSMHNIARLSILPIYPPFCISPTAITSPRTPSLLLVNVPRAIFNVECFFQNLLEFSLLFESLTEEQYARVRYVAFSSLFKL